MTIYELAKELLEYPPKTKVVITSTRNPYWVQELDYDHVGSKDSKSGDEIYFAIFVE